MIAPPSKGWTSNQRPWAALPGNPILPYALRTVKSLWFGFQSQYYWPNVYSSDPTFVRLTQHLFV